MFVCKQEALQGMTIRTYNTQLNLQTAYDDSGRLTSSHAEDEDCVGTHQTLTKVNAEFSLDANVTLQP